MVHVDARVGGKQTQEAWGKGVWCLGGMEDDPVRLVGH